MTVDLEAIARRSGCDISSLKLALPLVEQGFAPPFLARYRRDELGGVSEPALWMLQRSIRSEQSLAARREELTKLWQRTRLADKSIEKAIRDAKSKSAIGRVARRLKSEPADPNAAIAPEVWVASRLLNPEPGDSTDAAELAVAVGQAEHAEQIAQNIDRALARRLADHPQVLGAAVRWLTGNASIKFLEVSDPNVDSKGDDEPGGNAHDANSLDRPRTEPGANWPSPEQLTSTPAEMPAQATSVADSPEETPVTVEDAAVVGEVAEATIEDVAVEVQAGEAAEVIVADPASETPAVESSAEVSIAGEPNAEASATKTAALAPAGGKKKGKAKPIVKKTKVFKKLSPRQRRRRWLISILEPLVGKQIPIKDLSPFQTLVLSRALRGNLVRCQFVYDANQLIAQLQKTVASLNPALAERLTGIVATEEAAIREATESVWWDELQEIATGRLVDIAAAHLDEQLHRGPLEAKTVLAIDAVGPRTSPISIVSADGRVLHTEDIASQLENDLRTASVTRLGELIHRYAVDLIVIGNGPARRATMIILGELIAQSPEGSVKWTLAERSGADAYSGNELADREMRTTPRRFRAATWLAFSLLKPAWALAKVNPLRLRLSSAQRELPDELLAPALRDVMTSAISRGGLDVNAAAVDSLTQLPGVSRAVAEAIDRARRQSLFTSREQLLALEEWGDEMDSRQAIGFLRVFGGDEPLDATVIHPEDYSLARKLAKALKLELPPSAPPGYQAPSFDSPTDSPRSGTVISDQTSPAAGPKTESFEVNEQSPNFAAELLGPSDADSVEAVSSDGGAEASAEVTAETSADSSVEAAVVDDPVVESNQPVGQADDATAPAAESGSDAGTSATQPLPDPAAINRCIREWQVGSNRTHRLVHALCDPFGEEKLSNLSEPPAVMTRLPKPGDLRPGDQVVGVVASVASFGAFVEISPESTGLIRVSRLAEEFVEEIHDYIQVGDIVTAWVTEVDQRRKLQLSAISPQREEELRSRRLEARDNRNQRGGSRPGRGGQQSGQQGGQQSGQQGGQQGGQARSAQPRREGEPVGAGSRSARGYQGGGNQAGGNQGGQPNRGGGGGRGGSSEPRRGGGRDDSRRGGGDNRGRDRGPRREEPISYSTRSPKTQVPLEPITDAMAEGKEPLRSFGDLLQFFKKDQPAPPTETKAEKKPKPPKQEPKQEQAVTDVVPTNEPAPPSDSTSSDSTASEPSTTSEHSA
ncbi:MAG TPA: RNA-binding protein [Planctomycetaceae bacterium]|nr:RNA-binding protein [Planctomycetaceae bacterium]